ncbi:MAG: hypothetical protein J6T88_10500 [Bacteroidales bacterium]|nr:hypothetical protein [Bacteroidales bacterium]
MTIESKKTFALIGCAMAAMIVVAGNILMALQIKTQGSGFYVGYLFYSLAILAGGVFITWLPNMKNQKWGFRLVEGKMKWQKDTRVTDPNRTRLVWWPLITLFFELYGLSDYCFQLWEKPAYEVLKYIFVALTLLLLAIWCVIIIFEDIRESKKKNGNL